MYWPEPHCRFGDESLGVFGIDELVGDTLLPDLIHFVADRRPQRPILLSCRPTRKFARRTWQILCCD